MIAPKILCHCEEGDLPEEAISNYAGIALGENQERLAMA
jgi:hypothetical protein